MPAKKPTTDPTSIYAAFAATRLAIARSYVEISTSYNPDIRFWFVRFELYMALLVMMENFYAKGASSDPDRGATGITNLIRQMPCSYSKARSLIDDAVNLGYAELRRSATDSRVKTVSPTKRTIDVWQTYFDEAMAITRDTGLIENMVEIEFQRRAEAKKTRAA